ncbi:MAG: ribosomal protein L7/L12 [Minicystis sp.]
MRLSREEVIGYLEGLSGEELLDLADEILTRLGAPPLPRPEPVPVTTMGEMIRDVFSVRLRDPGPRKIEVITFVRRSLRYPIGLSEAKALVERAPVELVEGLTEAEAKDLVQELAALGATADVF